MIHIVDMGSASVSDTVDVLDKKPEANQWWNKLPVPGWPGYFWIKGASPELSLGIDTDGGVKSGSRLQAVLTEFDENQYWRTIDVPDRPEYFWIESALGNLVVSIDVAGGVKSGSRLRVLEKSSEPNQYWRWVEPAEVPAPSGGLGSWSNYFLYGGKTATGDYIPLESVGIEIEITEDLVGSPPLSFQLNCLSPLKKSLPSSKQFLSAWQQYGISMIPGSTELNSFANNWSVAGLQANPNYWLFNIEPNGFVNLANQTTIPKGSIITISLFFEEPNPGTITGSGVGFNAGEGVPALSQQIFILDQPLTAQAGGGTATHRIWRRLLRCSWCWWAGRERQIRYCPLGLERSDTRRRRR